METNPPAGMRSEKLHDATFLVALPEKHPLTKQSAIDIEQLRHEAFVTMTAVHSDWTFLQGVCREAGFSPRVVREAVEPQTVLALVSIGMGLTIMADSYAQMNWPGVTFRPLTKAIPADLYVVYDPYHLVGPGSLVALNDHINTMPGTPMVGPNDDRFGERFFSLANAYDADYRGVLQSVAKEQGFPLTEGVFVSYPGPNFETAAEIRMMQIIGGDVVGMSVVPEVISARHCGLKVVAVSAITNLAEGLGSIQLSHAQTLAAAALSRQNFINLICGFLGKLA